MPSGSGFVSVVRITIMPNSIQSIVWYHNVIRPLTKQNILILGTSRLHCSGTESSRQSGRNPVFVPILFRTGAVP